MSLPSSVRPLYPTRQLVIDVSFRMIYDQRGELNEKKRVGGILWKVTSHGYLTTDSSLGRSWWRVMPQAYRTSLIKSLSVP